MERPAVDSVESEEEEDDSDVEHCIQFVLASCVGVAHKCTIHCLMGASSGHGRAQMRAGQVQCREIQHPTSTAILGEPWQSSATSGVVRMVCVVHREG